MPLKTRGRLEVIPASSVSHTLSTSSGKIWDPVCERDPTFVEFHESSSYAYQGVPLTYYPFAEFIHYENRERLSKKERKKRQEPKDYWLHQPCTHLKSEVKLDGGGAVGLYRHLDDTDFNDFEGCGDQHWIANHVISTSEVSLNIIPQILADTVPTQYYSEGSDPYLGLGTDFYLSKIGQLDAMALDKMIPELDSGFSMPVFLFELIELKSLFSQVWRLLTSLPEFIVALFTKPLKELSDSFLSGIFGWIPFYNDIKTIAYKFENIDKEVSAFLELSGKVLVSHFQKGLSPETFQSASYFEPLISTYEVSPSEPNSEWVWMEPLISFLKFETSTTRKVEDLKFHATLQYTYSIPAIPAGLTRFLAEMDYWGINLSLEDVWAVVPFSFVVDWFLGINSWLQGLDAKLLNLPITVTVHQYSRSIKYRETTTLVVREVSDFRFADTPDSNEISSFDVSLSSAAAQNVQTRYYRYPGIPVPTPAQLPGFKTPKGLKWVIGSALVIQRKGGRKRHQ